MLRNEINDALKESMKAKDSIRVSTVRLILAAIKDRDIAARGHGNEDGITEEEILQLLQSMVKQRTESVSMYEKGGRADLADAEKGEIDIIKNFLPAQMDTAEIKEAVDAVIEKLEAEKLKDMGRVMAALREDYAGQMDFGQASKLVKQALS